MKLRERRRRARHALSATSRVLLDAEFHALECQTIDVSLYGLGVIGHLPLQRNAGCMVSFDLVCEGKHKRINACGKVVGSTPIRSGLYRIGISFADMDSRSRQLLESLDRNASHVELRRDELLMAAG